MKSITTLNDLFVEQARDVYDAEKQQLEVFPKFWDEAYDTYLKDSISKHIEKTEIQVKRLEEIFNELDISADGERSRGMKALIDATTELIERSYDPEVIDAALVTSIKQLNYSEIAGYSTLVAYARALGLNHIAIKLYRSLDEEKRSDVDLSRIAEVSINKKAHHPAVTF